MVYRGLSYIIELNEADSIVLSANAIENKTFVAGDDMLIQDTSDQEPEDIFNDTTEENSVIQVEDPATDQDANKFELTTETEKPEEAPDSSEDDGPNFALIFGITSIVLFLIVLYLAGVIAKLKKKDEDDEEDDFSSYPPESNGSVNNAGTVEASDISRISKSVEDRVGKLHNIGRRKGQQDSLGITEYNGGTLAVVADGMGGLADGDRVSQKIVMTLLQDSTKINGGSPDNKLYEMVAHANREVNQMLGPEGLYKSGSTLLAVMAEKDGFHWVAVGDSHIYLYRGKRLLLMNREHVYEAELIQKAINGENSFAEVKTNPKKGGLTSFIGMGNLKYIDGSIDKVASGDGDWILLMSDGVFNTVPERDICKILNDAPSAKAAAEVLEQEVLRRQNPKQDNFTAIILEL